MTKTEQIALLDGIIWEAKRSWRGWNRVRDINWLEAERRRLVAERVADPQADRETQE